MLGSIKSPSIKDNQKMHSENLYDEGMETLLQEVISNGSDIETIDTEPLDNCRVRTFDDAGIMTRNRGLVVRLQSGEEFQITIVQTRGINNTSK
jgi:hypothetical protein